MFTKLTLKRYVHVCTPDYITIVSWLDAHAPDSIKLPSYKHPWVLFGRLQYVQCHLKVLLEIPIPAKGKSE